MDIYCYNVVVFEGENRERVLLHFKQMPQNSPPFEAIYVGGNKLYFDSKHFPPLRDLNEVAERFDVNYSLDCSAYGEKSNYNYTCHQQQVLPQKGEEIRRSINNSSSLADLQKIGDSLQDAAYAGTLDNNHHLLILRQIMGKKHRELNPQPLRDPDEDTTRSRGRGR